MVRHGVRKKSDKSVFRLVWRVEDGENSAAQSRRNYHESEPGATAKKNSGV